MPYVIGAAVDDILLMQKGERYFLECETGEQTSWDLCIVMAPADKRHDESLQQVNCNFVEADGTTRADTARLHKILVHKWSPHVLQVVPPFWIRYMVDLRGRWSTSTLSQEEVSGTFICYCPSQVDSPQPCGRNWPCPNGEPQRSHTHTILLLQVVPGASASKESGLQAAAPKQLPVGQQPNDGVPGEQKQEHHGQEVAPIDAAERVADLQPGRLVSALSKAPGLVDAAAEQQNSVEEEAEEKPSDGVELERLESEARAVEVEKERERAAEVAEEDHEAQDLARAQEERERAAEVAEEKARAEKEKAALDQERRLARDLARAQADADDKKKQEEFETDDPLSVDGHARGHECLPSRGHSS